jgi:hypothetical protein
MLTRLALADDTRLKPLLTCVLYAIISARLLCGISPQLVRTSYPLSVVEISNVVLKFPLAGLSVPCSDCFYYLLEGKIALFAVSI